VGSRRAARWRARRWLVTRGVSVPFFNRWHVRGLAGRRTGWAARFPGGVFVAMVSGVATVPILRSAEASFARLTLALVAALRPDRIVITVVVRGATPSVAGTALARVRARLATAWLRGDRWCPGVVFDRGFARRVLGRTRRRCLRRGLVGWTVGRAMRGAVGWLFSWMVGRVGGGRQLGWLVRRALCGLHRRLRRGLAARWVRGRKVRLHLAGGWPTSRRLPSGSVGGTLGGFVGWLLGGLEGWLVGGLVRWLLGGLRRGALGWALGRALCRPASRANSGLLSWALGGTLGWALGWLHGWLLGVLTLELADEVIRYGAVLLGVELALPPVEHTRGFIRATQAVGRPTRCARRASRLACRRTTGATGLA
jgi:hypothetical protein